MASKMAKVWDSQLVELLTPHVVTGLECVNSFKKSMGHFWDSLLCKQS